MLILTSMKHIRLLATASLLIAPGVAAAQGPQRSPCQAPEHRQFDFWLGEWDVADSTGTVLARSLITSILGGCVIKESYAVLTGPYKGESYNTWDSRTKRWHQSWVDNGGLLALFDGGLRGNAMVLEGEGADPKGPFRSRMTFTPMPDGRVRQLWERSSDQGTTWTTLFDGFYKRAAGR